MPPRIDRAFASIGQSVSIEFSHQLPKEKARLPVGNENDYDPVGDLFEVGEQIREIKQGADALALLELKEAGEA